MSRVIRSGISETLQETTENLLNALIQRERLNIAERQVTEDESRGALSRLIQLTPLLPEGTPLAELGFLHPTIATAFPELDPTDISQPSSFGNFILNRETIRSVLRGPLLDKARELSSSPEQLDEILTRGVTREILGEAVSPEELGARTTRASLANDALESIVSQVEEDPEFARGIFDSVGRVALGLDQPVTVSIPTPDGGMRTITWDTGTAANLAVEIWKFMNQRDTLTAETSIEARNKLQEQTIEMAKQMGVNLSPAVATQMVSALFTDDPAAALTKILQTATPEVGAVIQAFTGATVLPGQTFQFLASQTPEGRATLMLFDAAEQAAQFLPIEQRAKFLENLSQGMIEAGVPMAQFTAPRLFGRGNTIEFPGGGAGVQPLNNLGLPPVGGDTPTVSAVPPAPAAPSDARIQAAINVLAAGQETQENIEEWLGPELVPSFRSLLGVLGIGESDLPEGGGAGTREPQVASGPQAQILQKYKTELADLEQLQRERQASLEAEPPQTDTLRRATELGTERIQQRIEVLKRLVSQIERIAAGPQTGLADSVRGQIPPAMRN